MITRIGNASIMQKNFIAVDVNGKSERNFLLNWLVHNKYTLSNELQFDVEHKSTISLPKYNKKEYEVHYISPLLLSNNKEILHFNNVFDFLKFNEESTWDLKKDAGICFLVAGKNQKEYLKFIKYLRKENFKMASSTYVTEDNNYVFINLNTKIFGPGRMSFCFTTVIGNKTISIKDFKTIYRIYSKEN